MYSYFIKAVITDNICTLICLIHLSQFSNRKELRGNSLIIGEKYIILFQFDNFHSPLFRKQCWTNFLIQNKG